MFDMKNENWYVAPKSKAEYAAIQEYLFAQGFGWHSENQSVSYAGQESYGETTCIVHLSDEGNYLGYSSECWATNPDNELKEIKLTFKTIVDSVEYPETQSPAQIELQALQQKIKDLETQANKLQELINK